MFDKAINRNNNEGLEILVSAIGSPEHVAFVCKELENYLRC